MSKIEINYGELKNNYNYVNEKINELLTLVENIDADCQSLCSSGSWEGALSTSFNSLRDRMHKYATQNVLNFKATEDYKLMNINAFKEAEETGSKEYE